MKTWTLGLALALLAAPAPAQEPPRDLSLLNARYQSERKVADDGYLNGVTTLNNRYIIGYRNLETSLARRGDTFGAGLARREREALEQETAALRERIAGLAASRESFDSPAAALAAALPPLPEDRDTIQIVEVLPRDPNPIPLEENVLVRVRFRIASTDRATITLKLLNKGIMFAGSGRPFTPENDEWEFSYNSTVPREADEIEVEIRDPRTNRLFAKDERKIRIVWK